MQEQLQTSKMVGRHLIWFIAVSRFVMQAETTCSWNKRNCPIRLDWPAEFKSKSCKLHCNCCSAGRSQLAAENKILRSNQQTRATRPNTGLYADPEQPLLRTLINHFRLRLRCALPCYTCSPVLLCCAPHSGTIARNLCLLTAMPSMSQVNRHQSTHMQDIRFCLLVS